MRPITPVSRSVWSLVGVDSRPAAAQINVPKGTASASGWERWRATARRTQYRIACSPVWVLSICQPWGRRKGGKRRNRTGQDQCPSCNNASEGKVLTTVGLWFQLTEPFQVLITHCETPDPVHHKHRRTFTHTSKEKRPPTHRFHFVFLLVLIALRALARSLHKSIREERCLKIQLLHGVLQLQDVLDVYHSSSSLVLAFWSGLFRAGRPPTYHFMF